MQRPVFALIAIATVGGISIGAATSIFSIVDGVLFRSRPYHEPGHLVSARQTIPGRKEPMLVS